MLRTDEEPLGAPVGFVVIRARPFEALGFFQLDPVGGLVAGACVGLDVHEGLGEWQAMAIVVAPVGIKPLQAQSQDARSQVGVFPPRGSQQESAAGNSLSPPFKTRAQK